jgi:hypothetical protein
MKKRSAFDLQTAALCLLGLGLATSSAAVPLGGVELIHPTTTHGLLATVGLLGLAFGGRSRD